MTAPLRFALVPVEQDIDMDIAWREIWYSKRRCIDDADTQDCYTAMLAASPGNDLLERIVRARDNFEAALHSGERTRQLGLLLSALDELGGGHG